MAYLNVRSVDLFHEVYGVYGGHGGMAAGCETEAYRES
jgi:hypothetical protein